MLLKYEILTVCMKRNISVLLLIVISCIFSQFHIIQLLLLNTIVEFMIKIILAVALAQREREGERTNTMMHVFFILLPYQHNILLLKFFTFQSFRVFINIIVYQCFRITVSRLKLKLIRLIITYKIWLFVSCLLNCSQ